MQQILLYEDGQLLGAGELSADGQIREFTKPLSETVSNRVEAAIEKGMDRVNTRNHIYSWQLKAPVQA